MTSPTARQRLLNLVDRAERGRLTPAEAAVLRTAVLRLLDAPAIAAAQRDVARAELAAARKAAAAAETRLARVLAQTGTVSPLLVACPSCGALPGDRCRAARGSRRRPYVEHAPRRRAVGAALFAEALTEAL